MTGDNHFSFVAPMFNASGTLPNLLHSLYGQSYDNWSLTLIDDVSDSDELASAKDWLERFDSLNTGKVSLIINKEKKWEVANVLHGISMCNDNDIVCRIDADDSLCDLDALAILDSVYTQTKCDVAWSMHRWGQSDRNISESMPDLVDPYTYKWVSSHLKTFRKCLINNIPYENFTNMNGELVKRAGDQAIYLPVLKCANKRVFIPRALYSYTIDEQGGAVYQTDDAKFQKAEADFIRLRGYISTGETWEQRLNVINVSHQ